MDLRELGGALWRRWYITVLIVLTALGAGWGAMQVVGAKYVAVSTAVLIPPQSTVQNAATTANYAPPNPLLYLGGLTHSRDVLLRKLTSQDISDGVADEVPGGTYEATNDAQSSGPLIVITVHASTPTGALEIQQSLQEKTPRLLQGIQKELGIAANNQITVLQLTTDQTALAERKSQIQVGVLVAGALLMGGLLLVGILDSLLVLRRRRAGTGKGKRNSSDSPVEPQREEEPSRRSRRAQAGRKGKHALSVGGERPEAETARELVLTDTNHGGET